MKITISTIAFAVGFCAGTTTATSRSNSHDKAAQIVAAIQRADYEGYRAGMQRGYDALQSFIEDVDLASRVRYWRGFAQWRRAINGFNDAIDPKELAQNLTTAIDEFKAVLEKDPKFVDAKVGIIYSLGFLLFAQRPDESGKKQIIDQIRTLAK